MIHRQVILRRAAARIPSGILFVLVAAAALSTAPRSHGQTVQDLGVSSGFQDTFLDKHKRGRALVAADFDLDGLVDFYVGNPSEENFILRNTTSAPGSPTFLLDQILPITGELTWGAVAADYDNDGDYDLFIPIGANEGIGFDYLFKNLWMESGQTVLDFVDVTAAAGVAGPVPGGLSNPIPVASAGAVWGDYDLDGDVDLFVNVNIDNTSLPPDRGRNILWRNNADGTFTDVTMSAGLGVYRRKTRHSTFVDVDNDGDLDLYESNYTQENVLWKNELKETGDAHYVEATDDFADASAGESLRYPRKAFASTTADFNNDGWQDILVFMRASNDANNPYGDGHALFLNQGGTGFVNVAAASGLNSAYQGVRGVMGCQIGDLNGDGVPDVFLGNGGMRAQEGPTGGQNNQLYLSDSAPNASPHYVEHSTLIDFPAPVDGSLTASYPPFPYRAHGSAIVDVDNDGILELAVSNGGPAELPDDVREPNRLFAFTWPSSFNWLKVRAVGNGTTVSRDAIGTRLKLTVSTGGGPQRALYGTLLGGSAFSAQNGFEVYFGLGDADTVHSMEITWPDGLVETRTQGLSLNSSITTQYANPSGDVPATMTAEKIGSDVRLTWGASCDPADADFEVYEGPLGGDFTSHASKFCTTSGATTMTFGPPAGAAYWLVVPHNGQAEGSYGRRGDGSERPQGQAPCRPRTFNDADTDSDAALDCGDPDDDNDGLPDGADPDALNPHVCGDGDADGCDDCTIGVDGFGPLPDADASNDGPDADSDGVCDAGDGCPADPNKIAPGVCGCGVPDGSVVDTDGDGSSDCNDPDDDNDGVADGADGDAFDPMACQDADSDGCDDCSVGFDGFGPLPDNDPSNDGPDADSDGACDAGDACPADPAKTEPGDCGCGVPEDPNDTDGDGDLDCTDGDDDNDGIADASDTSPLDPDACTDADADSCDDCSVGADDLGPLPDNDPANDGPDADSDGACDAGDGCPSDAAKTAPGACGCGTPDTDSNLDGTIDCLELDTDGDGTTDSTDPDDDNDGVGDGTDSARLDPDLCVDVDADTCDDCAVGTDDFGPLPDNDASNDGPDGDGDGACDAGDGCPADPNKTVPGLCGCGLVDTPTDTDADGQPDCIDGCPNNPLKIEPGECGCNDDCRDFTDDFSTDPFSNRWNAEGNWTWQSSQETVDSPSQQDELNHIAHDDRTDEIDQYARVRLTDRNGEPGFLLRVEGSGSSVSAHMVRFDPAQVEIRFSCVNEGSVDPPYATAPVSTPLADGDFLCVEIVGPSSNATIRVWKNCDEPRAWTDSPDIVVNPGNACTTSGRRIAILEGGAQSTFDDWSGGDI